MNTEIITKLHPIEVNWEGKYQYALSALSWAVGKLEGAGLDTGYAGRALEEMANPVYWLPASYEGSE